MTILEMLTAMETTGDATVWQRETREGVMLYDVTMEDFEGFDDEWREVDHEYADEDMVEAFFDAIEEQAVRTEGDFYTTYYFDGYAIRIGFASYEI